MADERIGEQQKEIYENAMRTHKKRMGIVFLVLVCTYSFVFFGGQLIDKGGEWRNLFYLAGAIVVFLSTLLHPLTADSDLSAHIRKWKIACLLGPIIFAVGMFLLGTFITAGAQLDESTSMSFPLTLSLGAGVVALVAFYLRTSYLRRLFVQYDQAE